MRIMAWPEPSSATTSMSVLIEQLTGFVRRQYRIFVIVPAAAIALGLLYLIVTPALYTATATVLIDGSALRALQNQLQPLGDVPLDTDSGEFILDNQTPEILFWYETNYRYLTRQSRTDPNLWVSFLPQQPRPSTVLAALRDHAE
jgi:Bacterial transglutaminase-like cysteine proteinase BTLCP/Chain length determinant protein